MPRLGHNAALACHVADEAYFRKTVVTWKPYHPRLRHPPDLELPGLERPVHPHGRTGVSAHDERRRVAGGPGGGADPGRAQLRRDRARAPADARGFFESYVATYLERVPRAQLQVGSLRDFERFLRAAALRTAQLLNRAELSRDVGVSSSTAGQWLSVLERSGIVALLEPWFSNRTKTLVKTPKLHFHDTGLCAFLMGLDSIADLRESPLAGALWETLVFSELHRLLASGLGSWQLAFWRDRTKEVDFLLHKAGRVLLADAKWAEHPDGPGRLERVRAEFRPPPPAAIVCRSPTPYPLAEKVTAQPLSGLTSWLSG